MMKGQAASTDALLFLTIVSGIFVLIVSYGLTYGNDVVSTAEQVYKENYHNSALKSFFSASGSRDGNTFNESNYRDSISTLIKEDYGWGDVNTLTKISAFLVLEDIFKPYNQRDYFLSINHTTSANQEQILTHLFTLIKITIDDEVKYYDCTNDFELISFLENVSLDLIVVEGKFLLFNNIITSEAKKEDGAIYLGSWLSHDLNTEMLEECKVLTTEVQNVLSN